MTINRRIERLQREVESIEMKDTVRFFDSYDEYLQELQRGSIKAYHICMIDDVPEDDDNEHITIHE